jgi:hypothetical protein
VSSHPTSSQSGGQSGEVHPHLHVGANFFKNTFLNRRCFTKQIREDHLTKQVSETAGRWDRTYWEDHHYMVQIKREVVGETDEIRKGCCGTTRPCQTGHWNVSKVKVVVSATALILRISSTCFSLWFYLNRTLELMDLGWVLFIFNRDRNSYGNCEKLTE